MLFGNNFDTMSIKITPRFVYAVVFKPLLRILITNLMIDILPYNDLKTFATCGKSAAATSIIYSNESNGQVLVKEYFFPRILMGCNSR